MYERFYVAPSQNGVPTEQWMDIVHPDVSAHLADLRNLTLFLIGNGHSVVLETHTGEEFVLMRADDGLIRVNGGYAPIRYDSRFRNLSTL